MEAGAFTEAGARAREVNRAREEESRRREDVNWARRTQAYSTGSPLRQPRFPGGGVQTQGQQIGTGVDTLAAASRGFGEAGGGYRGLAGDYGQAAGSAMGQAAGWFMDRYGDRKISNIFTGTGINPNAPAPLPRSAGVSPGAGGYPEAIFREF